MRKNETIALPLGRKMLENKKMYSIHACLWKTVAIKSACLAVIV